MAKKYGSRNAGTTEKREPTLHCPVLGDGSCFRCRTGVKHRFGIAAGRVFARIHPSHAGDGEGHVHAAGHGHHHHDNDGAIHHHDDATGDSGSADQGEHRLRVHYDGCCPSIVMPVVMTGVLRQRVTSRVALLPAEPMQGAPPGCLLRPPIS